MSHFTAQWATVGYIGNVYVCMSADMGTHLSHCTVRVQIFFITKLVGHFLEYYHVGGYLGLKVPIPGAARSEASVCGITGANCLL